MFEEWCNKTSLNGISDLYESKSRIWRFGFWFIVMIAMLGLTILFITLNTLNFINSPTVVNVATIADTNLETPDLLLCYKGGVNVVAMKHQHFSDEIIKAVQLGFIANDPSLNYSRLKTEFQQHLNEQNMTIEDFYKYSVGYPCDEIVIRRKPAGLSTINAMCANVTNFIGRLGQPCLLFESNGFQKWPSVTTGGIAISVAGPNGSDPNAYEELGLISSFDLNIEKHFLLAIDQGVEIPLRYRTNILMSLSQTIRLNKANPCDPDTTFTTSHTCYQYCMNKSAKKFCNCTIPGLTAKILDPNTTMCNVFQFQTCPTKFNEIEQAAIACAKSCLPICNEHLYSLTVSHLPIPNNNLANISITYTHQQYTRVRKKIQQRQ